MSTVPYKHITQGPAMVRYGPPVVVAPSRTFNPLLPLCCIALILLLIAATIILALIPVYLSARGNQSNLQTIPFNALYRINNGTLPIGTLLTENCVFIQTDEQNFAASNSGVSPITPIVVQCTDTGNTTLPGNATITRRRRQSQSAEGNLISLNGFLPGCSRYPRGAPLKRRAERFIELLLGRGTFYLTLAGANGTLFVFSITVISASISPAQSISSTSSTQTSASAINDIAILNFALTLEQLEENFYARYQASFTVQDFIAANYSAETYTYFNLIFSHEQAHVRILSTIVSQLGGTPVGACTYNFSSVTNVTSYIALARIFENTGTMAYDGAANGIADTTLREVAATIATVEARHAAYLNSLEGIIPFPSIFENATAPALVIQAISPFLISCPFTITVPIIPYIGSSSYSGTVPTSNKTSISPYTDAMYLNDLNVLNYALVAEHLEATFYNTYASNFTSTDFTSNGYPDATFYFIMIREIENAHVAFLQNTITQRGGTPVALCTYNFNVTNVIDFVNISRTLENTGVKAYDGAINRISDPNLILYAATIATVEARSSSFLNKLSGYVPFPNITDPTLTPSEVVVILSAHQTCPFTPTLPVILSPSTDNINSNQV